MPDKQEDQGVIAAMMQRFENYRLPRALSIKQKMEQGDRLSDADIDFLERIFADAMYAKQLADNNPEYQKLCAQVCHLYHEITEKALQNEKQG